jgi:hypothetical protein
MKNIQYLMIFCLLGCYSISIPASDREEIDSRVSLNLTESEKNKFLSEMREMLRSVQGVIAGIGAEDREMIIRFARMSGNQMARNTPESVRKKLPQSFKEIGGPTHLMFEELAIRAETDDMDMLAKFTGKLMHQCLACHATFKAD